MSQILQSPDIYVQNSKVFGAGRGVFGRRDLKKGEVIELCPVIEIAEHDMANLKESILVTYFFFYGVKKEKAYLALGFGSLYNHSHRPNAMYKINEVDATITFIAIADISKDSEITFDYTSGNHHNADPLWFEVK